MSPLRSWGNLGSLNPIFNFCNHAILVKETLLTRCDGTRLSSQLCRKQGSGGLRFPRQIVRFHLKEQARAWPWWFTPIILASYSGGRNWEDHGSKPTQENSSGEPVLKIPITKKGLMEWLKH
jgi:hypothetical protein